MATTKPHAGTLDRTITILERSAIRDATGERTHTYDPVGTYPAHKEELGAKGGEGATPSGRDTSLTAVLFTLRYTPTITPTHRLRCEGVDYDIAAVREGKGRKQWTVLECKRRD